MIYNYVLYYRTIYYMFSLYYIYRYYIIYIYSPPFSSFDQESLDTWPTQ